MSQTHRLNKNNQVIGNPAFICSRTRHGQPVYAHHMLCADCGHEYHRRSNILGRSKCPQCGNGQGTPIPSGETVALSMIRKGDWLNGAAGYVPWKIKRPTDPAPAPVGSTDTAMGIALERALENKPQTDDDQGTEDDKWSWQDVVKQDDGIAPDHEPMPVPTAEDIAVASEHARSVILTNMGSNFKPWDQAHRKTHEIWTKAISEAAEILGLAIPDNSQEGEKDETPSL